VPRLFIIDSAKALSKAICAPLSPYRRPQRPSTGFAPNIPSELPFSRTEVAMVYGSRMDKNILTSVNFIKDCMLTKDEGATKEALPQISRLNVYLLMY
jgi:hypothetical protein